VSVMSSLSEKIIKPKLGLLELARQLGNVSQACKVMGYSRDTFYRFQHLYETGGEEALQELSRRKPIEKNRVPLHVEQAVIDLAIANPALGQKRVSQALQEQGILISSSGVRSVWLRNDLESFKKRLKALEAKSAQEGILLTEEQLHCLEKAKDEKEAFGEIETEHPGYLGSQDTYYVGTMKGVGRIYQQTFVDTYSRVALAKLYTEKTAITAADMLNDKVLPFFHGHNLTLLRVLTDRGTEYCGKVENHAFQLYLAVENIDHSKTKARSPQTNGMCERFHRTMKNEFYDIAFRKKLYHSLEQLQADVDSWLQTYNELRPHSGRFCYGKTPMQTFNDAAHIALNKMVENQFERPGISRPREDEIPSLEGVSDERGTASWLENNLEHNFNKTRIKQLEF
jgi:transposase InsO family protein